MTKPEIVTEEHLEYLDELRWNGTTNMFGAGAFLTRYFKMTEKEAREVLSYWMRTFGARRNA